MRRIRHSSRTRTRRRFRLARCAGGSVFESLTFCERTIRVRGFQGPSQTLFAHETSYLGGYLLFNLHCSSPVPFLFNTMSINPSPELNILFEAALHEFENRTGTNLVQHQVIEELVNCRSADCVVDVLQEQAQAFRNFRGDDGRVMTWLKQTVNILHSLSTGGVLGEGIGLVCTYSFYLTRIHHRNTLSLQPFPPANAIFAGIGILLGVCALLGFTRANPCNIFFPPGDQRC